MERCHKCQKLCNTVIKEGDLDQYCCIKCAPDGSKLTLPTVVYNEEIRIATGLRELGMSKNKKVEGSAEREFRVKKRHSLLRDIDNFMVALADLIAAISESVVGFIRYFKKETRKKNE